MTFSVKCDACHGSGRVWRVGGYSDGCSKCAGYGSVHIVEQNDIPVLPVWAMQTARIGGAILGLALATYVFVWLMFCFGGNQ